MTDDLVSRLRKRDAEWQAMCDRWQKQADDMGQGEIFRESEQIIRPTIYAEAADALTSERGASLPVTLRHEPMSGSFDKFHIDGLPRAAVLHRFTSAEPESEPHDHPFGFTSTVIAGGYVEEIFDPVQGHIRNAIREPGDSFFVPAVRIHRIVEVLDGECWTMILPGPWEQEPGFWQFRADGPYRRQWNGDWIRQETGR